MTLLRMLFIACTLASATLVGCSPGASEGTPDAAGAPDDADGGSSTMDEDASEDTDE